MNKSFARISAAAYQKRYGHTLHKVYRPQKPLLSSTLFDTNSPSSINFSPSTTTSTTTTTIQKQEWTPIEKRTGVLAVKKGMMSLWDEWGRQLPVTVLQMEDTFVVGHKKQEQHGYNAMLIGCKQQEIKSKLDVELYFYHIEHCIRASIGMCLQRLAEFKITPKAFIPIEGTRLNASHFVPGQFIDIQGESKEKGFQGVMKRWGFKGQPASHGHSRSHRSPGSIGQRKDPGKVFKGKKMAGHMGGDKVTVNSLQIVKIDRDLNLIYVKGSVPGPDGTIVKIRDAIFKRSQFDPYVCPPPFPTRTPEEISQLPSELKTVQVGADPLAT